MLAWHEASSQAATCLHRTPVTLDPASDRLIQVPNLQHFRLQRVPHTVKNSGFDGEAQSKPPALPIAHRPARISASLTSAMDSAESIPEAVWEGIDQVASTPWVFWLGLALVGVIGTIALVNWSQISHRIKQVLVICKTEADCALTALRASIPLRPRPETTQSV